MFRNWCRQKPGNLKKKYLGDYFMRVTILDLPNSLLPFPHDFLSLSPVILTPLLSLYSPPKCYY